MKLYHKFTFFAVNQVDGGEVIYCQRDFYVLIDINYKSISHEYGYRIVEHDYTAGSDYLYKIEDASQGEITLVPSYQNTIPDGIFIGNTVDFITIYLGVTIASENDLMQVRSYVDDANIINVKRIESLSSNGQTTYYFQIDCATGVEDLTNLNINFYYEGFENSESRDRFIAVLKERHYFYQEFILSPNQFQIPNQRDRYFLVARLTEFPAIPEDTPRIKSCLRVIPGHATYCYTFIVK